MEGVLCFECACDLNTSCTIMCGPGAARAVGPNALAEPGVGVRALETNYRLAVEQSIATLTGQDSGDEY